jgi:hypothetical protein
MPLVNTPSFQAAEGALKRVLGKLPDIKADRLAKALQEARTTGAISDEDLADTRGKLTRLASAIQRVDDADILVAYGPHPQGADAWRAVIQADLETIATALKGA